MKFFAKNQTPLEEAIALAHKHLEHETPGTKEYNDTVESLAALYKIKDPKSDNRVQFRDLIPIVAVVVPVLIVLASEHMDHTITSKSMAFIPKPKI